MKRYMRYTFFYPEIILANYPVRHTILTDTMTDIAKLLITNNSAKYLNPIFNNYKPYDC